MADEGKEDECALLNEGAHVCLDVGEFREEFFHAMLVIVENQQVLGQLVKPFHKDVDHPVQVAVLSLNEAAFSVTIAQLLAPQFLRVTKLIV